MWYWKSHNFIQPQWTIHVCLCQGSLHIIDLLLLWWWTSYCTVNNETQVHVQQETVIRRFTPTVCRTLTLSLSKTSLTYLLTLSLTHSLINREDAEKERQNRDTAQVPKEKKKYRSYFFYQTQTKNYTKDWDRLVKQKEDKWKGRKRAHKIQEGCDRY